MKSLKTFNLSQNERESLISAYKFGVLTKIVRHMKARHMAGEDQPLTLEDILDETRQLDVTTKVKQWLANEALNNNPKISGTLLHVKCKAIK